MPVLKISRDGDSRLPSPWLAAFVCEARSCLRGKGTLEAGRRGRRKRLGRWSLVGGSCNTILFYIGLCYVQLGSPFKAVVRGPTDSVGNGGAQGAVDKCMCVKQISRGFNATKSGTRAGLTVDLTDKDDLGEAEGDCAVASLFPGSSVCWLYWALGIWEWHGREGRQAVRDGSSDCKTPATSMMFCLDVEIGFSDESLKSGGQLGTRAGSRQGM